MFENTAKIVKENKHYLYPLLLQVGFMLKIQELLGSFGLIGLVLSIFLITVGHSEVVGGLKVIHQEESNVKEDLYCGIKRFKELFSTYFWLLIFKAMIAFAIGYVISWIFFNTKTATFWNEIFVKVENEMQYGIQDTARIISGIGGFVIFMASIFTDYLVKSLFFLAPYLLETKKVCGLQVIHLSLATIKGHMKEVFKLQAHYYIYIVLFSCLYFLINQTTRFIFLAPILSIGLVVVEVHLYRMEYVISKAQLFQKIMNEGKEL